MKTSTPVKLCLFLVLANTPVRAQSGLPNTDAVRAGVTEILSLITFGTVSPKDQPAQVTPSGADYHVRLPLKGFATPADAALEGVLRPLGNGLWDISSMELPSSGTIEPAATGARAGGDAAGRDGARRIEYSIGEQSIRGKVDPDFAHPTTVSADFGKVRLRSGQGEVHSEQEVARYVLGTTVSAESSGRLDLVSQTTATDWHSSVHAPNGVNIDGSARGLSAHVSVDGLDRAQGGRLLAAIRTFMAEERLDSPQPPASGSAAKGSTNPLQARAFSPGTRQTLRTMVDAMPGLLTRFNMEETVDGIRFNAGTTNSGTLQRVRLTMVGASAENRLTAHMDLGLDELTMANLPPDTAAYLPHHLNIRSALAGVPTGSLLALLRAVTEPNPNLDQLQAQATSLFGDPNARIGVESVSFDSGPMRVTGSVRFVRRPDGEVGTDIHMSATGVDAFIGQAQSVPVLQQILPVMFIAKGIARPDGAALTWDIGLGGGPLTVNGMPFGQPLGKTR